jgi:DNA-binding NarL/FixJ family response regulator
MKSRGRRGTVEQAVAKALESAPSLVLMDIHLKGARDGIDAAQEIGELGIPGRLSNGIHRRGHIAAGNR